MGNVEIKKVADKKALKTFVNFYYDLYRDCPFAVPFLYSDEMATLSPSQNPAYEHCEVQLFLAYKNNKVVGRVAAFINKKANERWNRKQVRFGWLDFVDDLEVSTALIKTVEEWGKARGMNEIAGPLGFTDMDREGMLIEGFDRLATMYINYNYPYYAEHINKIGGFVKDNDYIEFYIKIPETVPEKFAKLSKMIETRYNLRVRKFTRRELVKEGKGYEIFDILNQTYDGLYGFAKLDSKQIDKLVNEYIKIADLNLVVGVEDANINKLVGFGISFPSFSKALKKTHDGHLLPFGWWHLLKILKFHRTDTIDLLLIGVLEDYRSKGANALIFNELTQQANEYGFKWAEAMPQMETNKGVLSHWQYFETEQHRRHRCFCKQLS